MDDGRQFWADALQQAPLNANGHDIEDAKGNKGRRKGRREN